MSGSSEGSLLFEAVEGHIAVTRAVPRGPEVSAVNFLEPMCCGRQVEARFCIAIAIPMRCRPLTVRQAIPEPAKTRSSRQEHPPTCSALQR